MTKAERAVAAPVLRTYCSANKWHQYPTQEVYAFVLLLLLDISSKIGSDGSEPSSSSRSSASVAFSMSSASTQLQIRPYHDSDKSVILKIFEENIREEWGKYHGGQYLNPNAEDYIKSVVLDSDSDLHNIHRVYDSKKEDSDQCLFWVMEDAQGTVVGMCGLQILEFDGHQEGEIRRNYILPDYRGQGWGSQLCRQIQQLARELQLTRVICSTPEHGEDVLNFYGKLGFTEFGNRNELHKTPVKEVFLEWRVPQ